MLESGRKRGVLGDVATGLTFLRPFGSKRAELERGFPPWLSPSSVATRDNRSKLHSPLAAPSVRASAIDASIIALGLASVKALTVDLRSSLLMLGIVSELPLLSLNRSLNAKRMVKS